MLVMAKLEFTIAEIIIILSFIKFIKLMIMVEEEFTIIKTIDFIKLAFIVEQEITIVKLTTTINLMIIFIGLLAEFLACSYYFIPRCHFAGMTIKKLRK